MSGQQPVRRKPVRRRVQVRRSATVPWPGSWLNVAVASLAMVPVVALLFAVGIMVVKSVPAMTQIGLPALLGPRLVSRFIAQGTESYGLLGPIWGTLMLGTEALVIAIPISLAIAIVSTEYRVGPLSRAMGVLLGMLAGIPPVVYAMMGLFFIESFMRPEFGGAGLTDNRLKAAIMGVPQYNQLLLPVGIPNSLLLGGLLAALLIVPFMAPLIQDAIKNVPPELKEASFGLGAGRWYTLVHVILRWALPGMVSAAALGALKAVGEVTIAYFVVGTVTNVVTVPSPIWDPLEKTSPLSSAGAGLMGGIGGEVEGSLGVAVSVAYFAGFLLLLIAFAIMLISSLAESRLRKRLES